MDQFIKNHRAQVLGTLSGWDRVRFRGTFRVLSVVAGLFTWLNEQGVLLKNFKRFAKGLTSQLRASVEMVGAAAGKKIEYLASSALSKEALVQELLRREGVEQGLICIFSCVDPCRSFELHRDRAKKQLDLVSRLRKCLHWYLYFLHPAWGLCHVRIQSWMPFTVHICINGREWLCRSLLAAGIGFRQRDNCLVDVADVGAAQLLLNAQSWIDWSTELEALLNEACPAMGELSMRGSPLRRYWSADETEWATDVMFRSPEALAELYPSLLRHAMTTFGSSDVMRFLGRQGLPRVAGVHPTFQGEVVSDLKRRPEGVRIKHRVNANSIKMYDKQGSVLRIETTINDARDMRVHRASEADPSGPKKTRRLRKGVVDLPRRAAISQSANRRYLDSLAGVETPTPLGKALDRLAQPVVHHGHRSRGLHPLVGDDSRVAEQLLRGEFAVNGFRNHHIRDLLYEPTDDQEELVRQSGRVGRLLRMFRDHGLIYRVKGTHRYQVSAEGRRTLPAFLAARNADSSKLLQLAG
jgi:hypothetical protein